MASVLRVIYLLFPVITSPAIARQRRRLHAKGKNRALQGKTRFNFGKMKLRFYKFEYTRNA